MRTNEARRRASQGHTVFGSFVFGRDPSHVEICAHAGYDFVIIDMEHAALEIADVEQLVRAADAAAITPVVRVPRVDVPLIGRVLDTGARGILAPHVKSKADAQRLAEAVRYAPRGARGACSGVRATGYSSTPFDTHVQQSFDDIWVLALIEDAAAADAIDDILSGGDLHGVMPGPGDLSTSLGLPGQFTHPEVTKRVDRVIEAAARASVLSGMYIASPGDAARWIAKGARLIVYSIDTKILYEAFRRGLEQMRGGA